MLRKSLVCCRNSLYCILFIIFVAIAFLFVIEQHLLKNELLLQIPAYANKYITFKERRSQSIHSSLLKKHIIRLNKEESLQNIEKFGPVSNNSIVIVIQVHKFSNRLKYLVASLNSVRGIQDALVIFSHSYYDYNVNRLIKMVDFCRVLQIFYPYSLQLYPNKFPGFDVNDCPQHMGVNTAHHINCTGAWTPDIYGHFRNPEQSEEKLHWWWTANKVFDGLSSTRNGDGDVIFMDDSQYLLEDFLYMIIYMRKITISLPQFNIYSLGMNSNHLNENSTYRLNLTTWSPKYHANVFGFGHAVWNTIVSHFDLYCLVDEHSWAYSLQFISLNLLNGQRFKVISSELPRSFSSSCGKTDVFCCSLHDGMYQALYIQKKFKDLLFPPYLEVIANIEPEDDEYASFDLTENSGGWNDQRDKDLCSNITIYKVKKLLLDVEKHMQMGV